MFFAVLLDKNIRGTRFYQSALYMPVVLSLAIVGFIWMLIYAPEQGLLNNILGTNKQGNLISWLGDPSLNLWAVLVAASWRHIGYVMVLYLAGLKAVDPTLREAAAIDGANERQTFFRVVFPVLKPINIVVIVITVIESLRAFDLAFVVNKGLNGLELLSTMVTNNIIGETSRIGFGSAIAVVLLLLAVVPIIAYLSRSSPGGQRMTAASAAPAQAGRNRGRDVRRAALHAFLIAMAVLWMLPLAVRRVHQPASPRGDRRARATCPCPTTLNLDNYVDAWNQAELVRYFLNSLVIVVPAVLLVLFLASMMAFAVSRYSWRFNLIFLLLFTAANLLPPQVIITPLYRIFLRLWLPTDVGVAGFPSDNGLFYQQYIGIIAIHVAFQLGFCTFVLSNYMKTIPQRAQRGRRGGRGVHLEELSVGHHAAHAPGPGGACHPAGDVGLQRLLLGAGAHVRQGRQDAHHVGAQQPQGPVLHRLQPAGSGCRAGGASRRSSSSSRCRSSSSAA